jgi:hypothetical protein
VHRLQRRHEAAAAAGARRRDVRSAAARTQYTCAERWRRRQTHARPARVAATRAASPAATRTRAGHARKDSGRACGWQLGGPRLRADAAARACLGRHRRADGRGHAGRHPWCTCWCSLAPKRTHL